LPTPALVPSARTSGEVIATSRDRGGEQAGTLHSASSKGYGKPVILKTTCNSGQFYPVL